MDLQREISELLAIAKVYRKHNRLELAAEICKIAIDLQKGLTGQSSPDMAPHLYLLGEIYSDLGRYDEARQLYKEAVAIWARVHPSRMDNALYFTHSLERLQEVESADKNAGKIPLQPNNNHHAAA